MTGWIIPDAVFDGRRLRPDHAVLIEDGHCASVASSADLPGRTGAQRVAGVISPGFVDLQVNGGGGVLFNTSPTPEGLATIARAHHRLGTTAILATVITDSAEVLARAAEAVLAARDIPGIAGIHIEGPHISLTRKGTHDPSAIRPMEEATLAQVRRLRNAGMPVMITVAPETVPPDQIATLAATGAVVSLGHTDADAATVRAAIDAGARSATHLFNAMSQMQGRAPGVVGTVINSTIHAGIICDGIHVADEMVGLAIRARPAPDLMFLVSDAMPTVGGPDAFDLYGQTIHVENGRLVNAEGSLAGAHVSMAESVARLTAKVGVTQETAFRMAITVPSDLMGLDVARIEGRALRDLIHVDDGATTPLATLLAKADAA